MIWYFFILGLFLGSLFNTIALRLETGEKIIFSRSHCPKCGKILKWYELIPLVSFLIQKGKCRGCREKISLRYPAVELITGIWCALLAYILNTQPNFISLLEYFYYLIPLSILFISSLYDLKTYLVDNRVIILGFFWFLFFYFLQLPKRIFPERDFAYLLNYFFNTPEKLSPFISALVGFLIIFLIYALTLKRGIGFGDAIIMGMLGLYFKIGEIILILIFSSFWGSLYGIYMKITKNKKMIPFVPFIFLGVFSTLLFGQKLTHWYFIQFQ
jgi:prepilin signal peptidase PulO-like enzyme (type II secretory pathway)